MKHLLKELWYGNLTPCEDLCLETPAEKELQKKFWECTEKLEAMLPKEVVLLYKKREDLATDIRVTMETNAFINGFCLGIQLMTEVFGTNAQRKILWEEKRTCDDHKS